ncbi:hypothetical protein FOL47_000075 [Perkinsus chesapeaki]|uniref:5'-Nucleotidase C-terminal domain-containing protein n=1 Tax=Perkinsus chesapeaki TaxID=330153 RepID=A0A7J6N3N9_PERCH|nr:hypothetical protein FOL47_000075 [Perkinsus chesapeaki]
MWSLAQLTLFLSPGVYGSALRTDLLKDGKVSITLTTTNDVYSMHARPMSNMGYFFEGTPLPEFYSLCEKNSEHCYGDAKAKGMPEATVGKLYEMSLPATGGKVMTNEDSGCVDPSLFDDMVRDPSTAWGNTAQMAGTYKYLGLTADTDEYISMLPGDFVAMSYLSSITYGQHMVDMMNAAEIDLVTFGNHEFDFKNNCPPAHLNESLKFNDVCLAWLMTKSNFLYLGHNVYADPQKTVRLGSNLKVPEEISLLNVNVFRNRKVFHGRDPRHGHSGDYWFKMVKGKKICFAGTTQTSAAQSAVGTSNVWLSDMLEAGLNVTRQMNNDGCNLVIVLTHQREGYDVLFWRKAVVEEGIKIDAIIGGHDHFPAFLNLKHPTKPYIITPVWKMGMDGQMLGKFVFDFDDENPNGKLRFAHAIPVFDGQCDQHFIGTDNEEWWNNNVMQTWEHWVKQIEPLENTVVENLLFGGLYNTADIRSAESRVGNMLADLFLRNLSVNAVALGGANIRYGLSRVFTERIPLAKLYLYEECPFHDTVISYDVTLMELFGYVLHSAPIVIGIEDKARPVTSGFEVEIDPATTEHGGVTLIRFTGTSHMAGIVNRTETDCGHPTLKCGEIIWNAEEGWKVDPFTMVSIAVPDYNVRYSLTDAPTLRRSFHLTQMSDLCRRGADSYAIDLNGGSTSFACPPGPDFFEYLSEKLPWTDCGYVGNSSTTTPAPTPSTTTPSSRPHYTWESIRAADAFCGGKAQGSYCMYWQTAEGQVCHSTDVSCNKFLTTYHNQKSSISCWANLGPSTQERSVHLWTNDDIRQIKKLEGVEVARSDNYRAKQLVGAAARLPSPWLVGGENLRDLVLLYGILDANIEDIKLFNLPVRRWVVDRNAARVLKVSYSTAESDFKMPHDKIALRTDLLKDGKVSITLTTTNDVYSMHARPMSNMGYFFEGTPLPEFYSLCEKNSEHCYGDAKAKGMPEATVGKLYEMSLPATGGKVMTNEDSGCVDPSLFDDMVRDPSTAWGNTAQMAGTYKYLGLTADTDEYISMLPGDFVAMSYLSSITYGQHMVDMMNAAEIDLVTFGNHEFDFKNNCPPAHLNESLKFNDVCLAWLMTKSNFLYLGHNVYADPQKTVRLGSNLKVPEEISFLNVNVSRNRKVFHGRDPRHGHSEDYWFKMVKGKKICFAGTTQTSAAQSAVGTSNVWLSDMLEAGVNVTRQMNNDGCNLVIVLTHQREGYDVLFWRKAVVEEGIKIDAIIGGHDHFPAFLNLKHPTKPDIITPVWKMGMDGQMLGKFVFDFDDENPNGKLRFAHAIPVFDGQCDQHFIGTDNEEWWNNNVMQTWNHWVQPIRDLEDTQVSNLLFAGLYNTLDVRQDETRVGNTVADLFLHYRQCHFSALNGGSIRLSLLHLIEERTPLTALNVYELAPFLDDMVSFDISLLEVFSYMLFSAPVILGGPSSAYPIISGFEITIDPTSPEHGGLQEIRYAGTGHIAGIVNHTETNCGHPALHCGEVIWNAESGWLVDPLILVTVTFPAYNARYGAKEAPALHWSYHLTHMSHLCRIGAHGYTFRNSKDSPTFFACPPGPEVFDYLRVRFRWNDCGLVNPRPFFKESTEANPWDRTGSTFRDGKMSCWNLLGSTVLKRSMRVWLNDGSTPEGVAITDLSTPLAQGLLKAASDLPYAWYIGGENVKSLIQYYAIRNPDVQSIEAKNLPVRRCNIRA